MEQPSYTPAVPCTEAACTAAAPQAAAESGGCAQAAGAQPDAGKDDALQDRPVLASAPAADLLALGDCQASTQVDPPASTVLFALVTTARQAALHLALALAMTERTKHQR